MCIIRHLRGNDPHISLTNIQKLPWQMFRHTFTETKHISACKAPARLQSLEQDLDDLWMQWCIHLLNVDYVIKMYRGCSKCSTLIPVFPLKHSKEPLFNIEGHLDYATRWTECSEY